MRRKILREFNVGEILDRPGPPVSDEWQFTCIREEGQLGDKLSRVR